MEGTAPVQPEEIKWYKSVSYEDAKVFIKSNITSAARSFIAIGYYLKLVRDKEMYREDGHETIWDFAKAEYGISQSTASRYMSMNDRFSKDGNSPIIRDEYKEFGKSQLQEMLSLTDEQVEQVRPSDRVEDIRNIRKPKEIPYVHIPGQVELTDFPGVDPAEVAAAVQAREEMAARETEKQTYTISAEDLLPEPEQKEPEELIAISQQDSGPEVIHFTAGDRTIDSAYGATIAAVVRKYLDSGYARPEKECEVAALGLTCKVLKRQDITVFYTDTGRTVFDVENARLEEEYQYWNRNKGQPEPSGESQTGPEPPRPEQTHPEKSGKCIHRPEFDCTLEEAHKLTPGTGENCSQACCWDCVRRGDCKLECYSSERRPEVVPEEHDGESAAEVQHEPDDSGQERENIGGVPVFSLENKMMPDGVYGWKRSEIINGYLKALHREETYTIANKIIPIEFQVLGNTYKAKYDGFCYVSFEQGGQTFMFVELDRLKAEYAAKYPPKMAKPVATYDKSILQNMIKFEQDQLDMMGPSWIEKQPYHYTKHMMALEAYRMLLTAHEGGNVGIEQSGD